MRVAVLGRGGAGKSTFSRKLSEVSVAECVEVDKLFWQADLKPLSKQKWRDLQEARFNRGDWIADGDLGPYDTVDVRLRLANTLIVRDVPLWRCV